MLRGALTAMTTSRLWMSVERAGKFLSFLPSCQGLTRALCQAPIEAVHALNVAVCGQKEAKMKTFTDGRCSVLK